MSPAMNHRRKHTISSNETDNLIEYVDPVLCRSVTTFLKVGLLSMSVQGDFIVKKGILLNFVCHHKSNSHV